MVRLLRRTRTPLPDANRVGDKSQVLDTPTHWELDAEALLRAIKVEPAGASLDERVRQQLRVVFGLEGDAPSDTRGFPGAGSDQEKVRAYTAGEPDAGTKIAVAALLNRALIDSLLARDRSFVPEPEPNESVEQRTRRERLASKVQQREAERKLLLDGVREQNPADPILGLVEGREAGIIDEMYASRLLLERVYPDAIRGLSGTIISPMNVDQTVWKAKLDAFIEDSFLVPDRPRYTVALEAIGQWVALGDSDGIRVRSLLAPSFTYYLDPARQNRQWLRLRYENGRDRASPKAYLDRVMLTLGFEL